MQSSCLHLKKKHAERHFQVLQLFENCDYFFNDVLNPQIVACLHNYGGDPGGHPFMLSILVDITHWVVYFTVISDWKNSRLHSEFSNFYSLPSMVSLSFVFIFSANDGDS